MNWRKNELQEYGDSVIWLNNTEALSEYEKSLNFSSKTGYALNNEIVSNVEKFDIEGNEKEFSEWLLKRIKNTSVELDIVYGKEDVCTVSAKFFLDNWQDMFTPSRDDVFIMPKAKNWILFYCHEDYFEYGITVEA